jgi:hypothetical protein
MRRSTKARFRSDEEAQPMLDTTTMSEACTVSGCNHAAMVHGLCARHHRFIKHYVGMERLLRRAKNLAFKIETKDFAEYLVARGYDSESAEAGFVGQWFDDVWQYMQKLKLPQTRICAECGDEDADRLYARSDARYCSAKCRQKAYRKRVTDKATSHATSVTTLHVLSTSQAAIRNGGQP